MVRHQAKGKHLGTVAASLGRQETPKELADLLVDHRETIQRRPGHVDEQGSRHVLTIGEARRAASPFPRRLPAFQGGSRRRRAEPGLEPRNTPDPATVT